MTLGEKIVYYRDKKGWTQKALSGGRCGGLHGVLLHGRQICRGCAKARMRGLEAVKPSGVSKCHSITSFRL